MKTKLKKLLMTTLRGVVGFAIAFYFLRNLFKGASFTEEMKDCNYSLISLAVIGYAVALLISFYRWQKLMDVLGVHLSYWTALRLGMIGTFFNSALPGAVSGDVAKMIYIRHHAPGKKAEAILTIFLDRLLGLFGLLVIAVLACLLNLDYLKQAEWQVQAAALGVGMSSLGGAGAILALVFKDSLIKVPGASGLIQFGQQRLPEKICHIMERIITALDLYRNNHTVVLYAMVLSLMNHAIMAGILVAVAQSIQANATIPHYLLSSTVSNAISAVPISPGGFGIRDGITKSFLCGGGVTESKAAVAPILVTCVLAFWSLVGGTFYIIGRTGSAKQDLIDDDETLETT